MPARLPIPAAPARYETVASYMNRLSALHGMPARELWEPISTRRPGSNRRDVVAERLAALVGRRRDHLARALPELRHPAPDWEAWRHQPQPSCPRCDARHHGGPVQRLLPHQHYVCTRHRYWIGPPDAGQPATWLEPGVAAFDDIVGAQRRHLRLLRRYGAATSYDAVLTGFLICGHLWADRLHRWDSALHRWERRVAVLIPKGEELAEFSASRLFAAIYPEAVGLAAIIAAPLWRRLASGGTAQQQRFVTEIGARIGRPDYEPDTYDDPIAHWMTFDSRHPPSRPHATFPQTREHGSTRLATAGSQSLDRQDRSATWFAVNRRGGGIILHHRHIRPALVRDWSPAVDGITATIAASATTTDYDYGRLPVGQR